MQLRDLVKPIEDQTDEELEQRLREIRHKRDVVRPAARKHVERAAKKGSKTRVTKTGGMFDNLTEAEKQELIKALGG